MSVKRCLKHTSICASKLDTGATKPTGVTVNPNPYQRLKTG